MTKAHLLLYVLASAAITSLLAGCCAGDPAANAPTQNSAAKLAPTPETVPKVDPNAAFKTACRDRITAKMLDASAAKLAYAPLSDDAGFKATVTLETRNAGGPVTMEFTCRRNSNGEITTKLIAD